MGDTVNHNVLSTCTTRDIEVQRSKSVHTAVTWDCSVVDTLTVFMMTLYVHA